MKKNYDRFLQLLFMVVLGWFAGRYTEGWLSLIGMIIGLFIGLGYVEFKKSLEKKEKKT